jgi:uncharacterized repeat protein (TIGR01451 family)
MLASPSVNKVLVALVVVLTAFVAAGDAGSGPRGPRYVDLRLSLTGSTEFLTVGNGVAYFTVAVENRGPDAAPGVTVPVTLPRGLRFVESLGTRCRGTAPGVLCRFGRLTAPRRPGRRLAAPPPPPAHAPWGAGETFAVRAVAPGVGNVEALAWSTRREANQADNRASAPIVLHPGPPLADVGVTVHPSASRVEVGKELHFRITITNHGPGEAMRVIARLVRPESVWPSSFSGPSPYDDRCPGDVTFAFTHACLLSLAPGTSFEIMIGVRPRPSAVGSNELRVDLSSPTPDPNAANNAGSATVAVDPPSSTADLGVAVTAVPERVRVGEDVVYTIVVRNHGPDAAGDVRLHSEGFDQWTSFRDAYASQGVCDERVVCRLGTIPSGGTAAVRLELQVTASPPSGTLIRGATAITESFDPSVFDWTAAPNHASSSVSVAN